MDSSSTTENSNPGTIENSEPLQGLDFFPERRGGKIERSWYRKLLLGENRDDLQRVKCERQIHNLVIESA